MVGDARDQQREDRYSDTVERVAVAAAQAGRPSAALPVQLRGYDQDLFSIIRELWSDDDGSVGGWHFLTDELADRLVATAGEPSCSPLPREVVTRINAYIDAHLDEQILIDSIADVAGSGKSHFPGIFRRTFGISPHQYVIRVRLRRARRLIAHGCSIAEAAFAAGFADQSHLTNWLRRLFGATPGVLAGAAT